MVAAAAVDCKPCTACASLLAANRPALVGLAGAALLTPLPCLVYCSCPCPCPCCWLSWILTFIHFRWAGVSPSDETLQDGSEADMGQRLLLQAGSGSTNGPDIGGQPKGGRDHSEGGKTCCACGARKPSS